MGEAVERLAPARLSWAIGHADFAVNRRNNKEAEVSALIAARRLKGPVDHDLPVLAVHDPDDRLRALACGYACHATTLDIPLWSGDYPGFAQMELEQNHPGAIALFWAGCGGDQNPIPRRTIARAKGYGHQLADGVEAALRKPLKPVNGGFSSAYAEIDLPFAQLPSREQLLQDSLSQNRYTAARAKHLLRQIEKGSPLSATYPYPVQVWRLGPGADVGRTGRRSRRRLLAEIEETSWPGQNLGDGVQQ